MSDPLVNFDHGSAWVRADFHLHTKADKEFGLPQGYGENHFVSDYVGRLYEEGIGLGVITNHNKFDLAEYKALKKAAGKRGMGLFPGVELSVGDGANGIHVLIVFGEEWVAESDYVNAFLTTVFEGKSPEEYQQENGRTSTNLEQTIKKLRAYHKPFGVIYAHVEQRSGLWNELDGGRLTELGRQPWFQDTLLAFQKVRSHDKDGKCRTKVRQWLGEAYPAEVEGSDPKKIDEIGKGRQTWIRIGAFSIEAITIALREHRARVRAELPELEHAHITDITFSGGLLKGHTIPLSPGLNVLIGIRGSGKSSILESIRYGLAIPFGEHQISDKDYKKELVERTLGSGGRITLAVRDRHRQQFTVDRILRQSPDLRQGGELLPNVNIRETILPRPLYFGQKDLSATTKDFERDLVERLVGDRLKPVRGEIAEQQEAVQEAARRWQRIGQLGERIEEEQQTIDSCTHNLLVFKEHGVAEKLKDQTQLDKDRRHCRHAIEEITAFRQAVEDLLADHEDDLRAIPRYRSPSNGDLLQAFHAVVEPAIGVLDALCKQLAQLDKVIESASLSSDAFNERIEASKEAFAAIQQELAFLLQARGNQTLKPDDFIQEQKRLDQATSKLKGLQAEQRRASGIRADLLKELDRLNQLWLREYEILESAVEQINRSQEALKIELEFKGCRDAFHGFLQDMCRGSGLHGRTIQKVSEQYQDGIELFKDHAAAQQALGTGSWASFQEQWEKQLAQSLIYQVPNAVSIKYHGVELSKHSLGQRASALILFVLSQDDSDLIIIDQPEDDLDNQTIYKDVITLIRSLKERTQFIFATHNANIPVLGDADQVLVCRYLDHGIIVTGRSVDDPGVQQGIIDIMEGGDDAFMKRKEIYGLWKPGNR